MEWKHALPEDHTRYVPPTSQDGCAQGAVLVSEGVVVQEDPKECLGESNENNTPLGGDNDKVDGIVEETIHPSKLVSVERSPEEKVTDDEISEEVAVEGVEVGEKVLGDGIDLSSELVEEFDESLGGSAFSDRVHVDVVPENNTTELKEPQVDGVGDVTVDQIMDKAPRAKIQEYTAQDPTLAVIRSLADTDSDRYEWDNVKSLPHAGEGSGFCSI